MSAGSFERSSAPDDRGLKAYLRVVREHWWIVALAVVLTAAAALAYSAHAGKRYTSQSLLLVSPVGADDSTYSGTSVIRQSPDPTRDVETLAGAVETDGVASIAARTLGTGESLDTLRGRIDVKPIAQSYLVSIDATDASRAQAIRIANAFADATVAFRRAQFDQEVAPIVQRLQLELRNTALSSASFRSAVSQRLGALVSLQGAPDPSFRVLARAKSAHRSSLAPPVIVLLGAFVGLILGLSAAFIADSLLTRVGRERQLEEAFGLPVLAGVPKVPGRSGAGPLAGEALPASALEAFRTLRQNIAVSRRPSGGVRVVAITSAGPGDGKTTTALNLAEALAQSGQRTLLVDADLRRPAVGLGLSLAAPYGTVDVLSGQVPLADALVGSYRQERLDVLLANPSDGLRFDVLTTAGVERLLSQAGDLDFVVFDTSPLEVVADALPIAAAATDVLVVVRRRKTRMASLRRLLALLARVGVSPRGFVLIGSRERTGDYGYYARPPVSPPASAPPASEQRVAP